MEAKNEVFKQTDGAFEIAQGITAEEMRALFFDKDALREPPYRVFQLNSKDKRYYYTIDNGRPTFYPSVTTIIRNTVPTSPFLERWKADLGAEKAAAYMEERAAYGTFMHAQFERLLMEKAYDLDKLKGYLRDYMEDNKLPDSFIYYADELKKDILSFAQFVIDYKVKPIAIEVALVHPTGYAGMIDLPCTMLKKIGGEERVATIIDFKSGRKGFYEDHEIQLGLYREMWNVNFPDLQIERIANFSPKEWRKKPTYNYKDQTKAKSLAKIPYILALSRLDECDKDEFTAVSGVVTLNDETDLENNITRITLSDLVTSKTKQK